MSLGYGDIPVSKDVWHRIMGKLINDPLVSPVESASSRAAIACVSPDWRDRVYTNPLLWSSIALCKDVPMGRLELVPSVSRWKTIELVTENPVIFTRVRSLCEGLPANSLSTLELSYMYMPGYCIFPRDDGVYELPSAPGPWFCDVLPNLSHLISYCTPFAWSSPGICSRLQTVDITDFSCPSPMNPADLQMLFSAAVCMRSLRFGAMAPFDWPQNIALTSQSLRAVDIQLNRGILVASILRSMDVPNVTDLVVREVGPYAYSLLECQTILARITRFTIHDDFPDAVVLHQLLTSLASLDTLDLIHSTPSAFYGYCEWAFTRLRFLQPNAAADLVRLYLGAVDLDIVAILHVPDFAFTPTYTMSGSTRDIVYGRSYHSLFWNNSS
ncbi:hypothetical protein FB451DRAFT_1188167 [Mycena latifolia]|nr:hypothetical protein FB451DRAFT_1188167 [Mycena latifolia]